MQINAARVPPLFNNNPAAVCFLREPGWTILTDYWEERSSTAKSLGQRDYGRATRRPIRFGRV
jgi:hypothetical protein